MLIVGVCMIVLPGPAFVVIPVGLGILGIEFAWARIWLRKAKAKAEEVARNFNQRMAATRATANPRQSALAIRSGGRTCSSRAKRTGGDPYDNTLS